MTTAAKEVGSGASFQPFLQRTGVDRRDGEERRLVYDLSYFERGGTERRAGRERRARDERRAGWVRLTQWHSVCIQPDPSMVVA